MLSKSIFAAMAPNAMKVMMCAMRFTQEAFAEALATATESMMTECSSDELGGGRCQGS
jgi:hypothetical protein